MTTKDVLIELIKSIEHKTDKIKAVEKSFEILDKEKKWFNKRRFVKDCGLRLSDVKGI